MKKNTLFLNGIALVIIIIAALFFWIYVQPTAPRQEMSHDNHPSEHTHETEVELTPEAIKANAIKIETAKSANLEMKINVVGKIVTNAETTVPLSARFPGIIKSVHVNIGDLVQTGKSLAIIESNESLQDYEIKSPQAGRIISKNANKGMNVSGQEILFTVADLRTVWADFAIYRSDISQIKLGNPVEVATMDGLLKAGSHLSYISPLAHDSTQSIVARAVLFNYDEKWKPGMYVSGAVTTDKVTVPVAVKPEALQKHDNAYVVFVVDGNRFQTRRVTPGRQNKEWVEITSGLAAGEQYVTKNSYIIKADLEKGEAEHE